MTTVFFLMVCTFKVCFCKRCKRDMTMLLWYVLVKFVFAHIFVPSSVRKVHPFALCIASAFDSYEKHFDL